MRMCSTFLIYHFAFFLVHLVGQSWRNWKMDDRLYNLVEEVYSVFSMQTSLNLNKVLKFKSDTHSNSNFFSEVSGLKVFLHNSFNHQFLILLFSMSAEYIKPHSKYKEVLRWSQNRLVLFLFLIFWNEY